MNEYKLKEVEIGIDKRAYYAFNNEYAFNSEQNKTPLYVYSNNFIKKNGKFSLELAISTIIENDEKFIIKYTNSEQTKIKYFKHQNIIALYISKDNLNQSKLHIKGSFAYVTLLDVILKTTQKPKEIKLSSVLKDNFLLSGNF